MLWTVLLTVNSLVVVTATHEVLRLAPLRAEHLLLTLVVPALVVLSWDLVMRSFRPLFVFLDPTAGVNIVLGLLIRLPPLRLVRPVLETSAPVSLRVKARPSALDVRANVVVLTVLPLSRLTSIVLTAMPVAPFVFGLMMSWLAAIPPLVLEMRRTVLPTAMATVVLVDRGRTTSALLALSLLVLTRQLLPLVVALQALLSMAKLRLGALSLGLLSLLFMCIGHPVPLVLWPDMIPQLLVIPMLHMVPLLELTANEFVLMSRRLLATVTPPFALSLLLLTLVVHDTAPLQDRVAMTLL